MAWQVEGTYFENCNCDSVCPCVTSALTAPGDYERCQFVIAFHVDSGQADEVDVSGHSVVLVGDAPGMMAEGNWKLGLVIDATASGEQADSLAQIFSGQVGGPMAAFAPLVGENLGVERAAIEFVEEGRRHSLKIGDDIDIEIEDFAPPDSANGEVSKVTGLTHFANSTLAIATAKRGRVHLFGLAWDNTGQNGNSAPFSWSG